MRYFPLPRGPLPRFVAVILLFLVPVIALGHGGGHGGGGHGGGGHMGGGGFHGGGSFHGGGAHYGGGMRMAPSHSVVPSRSFAPSHSVAPSRSVAPNVHSGGRLPTANAHVSPSVNHAVGGAHHAAPAVNHAAGAGNHNASRGPIANANATAAATAGAGRHTSWHTASHSQLQNVHSNMNNAVKSATASQHHVSATPQHANALASKGNTVRNNWNHNHHRYFYNNWWIGTPFIGFGGFGWYGGWGYSPWLNYYPWSYWWSRPSWNACVAFMPGYGWNNGYYYDYGPGGNVIYGSGGVTVNGQVVGSAAEYAQSAAELANVDPAEMKAVQPADWLALGTFSMAVRDDEVDPARVVQLAVSKDGLISGTIHNRTSGNTYTVQGRVDKETQRVAFTIGDDRNTVLETGIYNLTQDQTPVLCHFGTIQTQTYTLVRLPEPENEPDATPATPGTQPAPAGEAVPPPPPVPANPPADNPPAATPANPQER